ncbi:phosphotransferase [Nesterenkonia xinjiangensis]|uniref:Aminoglycoside phosphotransferase (APT) family kinase protein n=1 Tax=Nesterenkonia xinjiangensis TaxID=225327 RepID=A0A7Z0GNT9_9MICC|nr:aminoglycoside phosphotransferase (APT) family kinase protein [Nesterenkonia xinjiangensis]
MRWTSMELAALATAAVPGLSPTGVAAVADDARDFTSAIVIDSEGNRWRIRSPQHQEAAMRLETELQVLRGFSTAIRAELPFRVPSVAGAVRRGEMRTFVYNHLPGRTLELEELTASGAEVIGDVGRTIAAIHDLDESVVDHADLPRYSAERFRQRRLNELDQAATTGQIPSSLLRRWEHAMEEKLLWDFTPTVGHGDLHEDNLLVEGERVVAVTGWTDLHIGDPADDFAWLAAAPDPDFAQAVLTSYQQHRRGPSDPYLMRRAALTAEFALAQWLVRGHATENQEMVEEARGLLRQLVEDIEAHGGQPISLTPMQGEEPATEQDSRPVARAGAAATVADTGEWAESGADDHEPVVITDASAEDSSAPSPSEAAEEGAGEPGDEPEASGGDEPATAPAESALDDDAPTGQLPAVSPGSPASPASPASPGSPESPSSPVSPASPVDDGAASTRSAAADEQPTGDIPRVVDDSLFLDEDDTPTGTISPVPETAEEQSRRPESGSLPIVADAESEKRAKQKNFFPAQSADSARSAPSADTGTNPVVPPADVPDEARGDASPSHGSGEQGATAVEPTARGSSKREASVEDSDSSEPTDGGGASPSSGSSPRSAIYSTYPGLRPPGS